MFSTKLREAAVGGRALRSCFSSMPVAGGSNAEVRTQLATAYRALDRLGMNEGICNHLSAMAPARSGSGQVMLLQPEHQAFSEVTPDSLLGIDEHGDVVEGDTRAERSAFAIHLGLRQSRPGAQTACAFHTHMPYATTLACLKDPTLRMVHQNSLRFWRRVSYDTGYTGVASALEEGRRLGDQLGDDTHTVLMMAHHGVLAVAGTVAEAFDNIYYLERACQLQVMAMWTGRPLAELTEEQCQQLAPHVQDPQLCKPLAQLHLECMARQHRFL